MIINNKHFLFKELLRQLLFQCPPWDTSGRRTVQTLYQKHKWHKHSTNDWLWNIFEIMTQGATAS